MADDWRSKFVGVGQMLLGAGLVVKGLSNFGQRATGEFLERVPSKQPAALPASSAVRHARIEAVGDIADRVKRIKQLAVTGSVNPMIRQEALGILTKKCRDRWCVTEKDYGNEVAALFWALRDPRSPHAQRYIRDHVFIDQFNSAESLKKLKAGDCFVRGTRVLRREENPSHGCRHPVDCSRVEIQDIRTGDYIWGNDAWTRVEATWDRGRRATWLVRLNNGTSVRLTPEHKVWLDSPTPHRVHVSELRNNMPLKRPSVLPFGVTWADEYPAPKSLRWRPDFRITEVIRDDVPCDTFDIATQDHHVWLPEADWTVSNCDDGTIRLGAWLMSVGYPVKMRVVAARGGNQWSHIYLLAGIPPTGPTRWISLDWSVTTATPGWEAPGAHETSLTGRPSGAVERVRDFDITSQDFRHMAGVRHGKPGQ